MLEDREYLTVGMFKWILGTLISVLIIVVAYSGREQRKIYDTVASIDKRLAVVEALIKQEYLGDSESGMVDRRVAGKLGRDCSGDSWCEHYRQRYSE